MKNFRRVISLLLAFVMTASLLSISIFAAGGYSITVNGVTFKSDENKSGDSWSYDEASNILTLQNYSGGPIVSGGNLEINVIGSAIISGTPSNTYSSSCCGISVNGTLELIVCDESSATIVGADNSAVRGGDGIVATNLTLLSSDSSSLEILGGKSESEVGGFAIKASNMTLQTKNLTAKGGNDASALYFASNLRIKTGSNATFVAGSLGTNAITYLSSANYNLDSDIRSAFSNKKATVYFSSIDTFKYGDILVDGYINTKDAVLLAQYLADWDVDMDESAISAADVYYDGKINAADAVRLAQYLADWSGITLGK